MLSYTEELVSEYYKHLEDDGKARFLVSEHVQFPSKKKYGWSDIDILAIGKKEIHIIQTKGYVVYKRTVRESIADLVDFFKEAENFVRKTFDVGDKRIIKVFIADTGLSDSMREQLKKNGIDRVLSLKEIVKDFFKILRQKYPDMPAKVGKEENNVTRTLLFLLYSFEKEFKKAGI